MCFRRLAISTQGQSRYVRPLPSLTPWLDSRPRYWSNMAFSRHPCNLFRQKDGYLSETHSFGVIWKRSSQEADALGLGHGNQPTFSSFLWGPFDAMARSSSLDNCTELPLGYQSNMPRRCQSKLPKVRPPTKPVANRAARIRATHIRITAPPTREHAICREQHRHKPG